MRTGQAHRTLVGHTGPVTCLQFDEYHLVSGSLDRTIRVRLLPSTLSLFSLLSLTALPPSLSLLSPRSTRPLLTAEHALARPPRPPRPRPRPPRQIWDLRTGSISDTLRYDHAITSLQFDSRKVLCTAGGNDVSVYNRTTMERSSLRTNGHSAPAERLRFMDRYAASGGRDACVKVWALQ